MTVKINLYGEELNTYKANFHMHSTVSDGKLPLQDTVNLYRAEGYDILAATDHRIANRVSEIDTGDLMLMSGMEFHPLGPRGIRWHFIALNVPEDFPNPSDLPCHEAIEAVRKAGGESIVAHPYWNGFTSNDIMQVKNLIAIEVYNTDTRYIGKGCSVQTWDELLNMGYHLPGIAVDDTHRPRDFFGGWTMVCAKEKTPRAAMNALKNGAVYASQGPDFHKISFENNIFSVECSPCEEIIVMSNGSFGRCGNMSGFEATTPEARYKTTEMSSFETEIPHPTNLTYLRCQIKDKAGNYAWSSPIKID
ncbi:MAG: CehA/McbA family metallohydrolase [Victivallaceae bacterium]|nr:CehA/McbA family metallohydrolase [Victivallaceae bacterium]